MKKCKEHKVVADYTFPIQSIKIFYLGQTTKALTPFIIDSKNVRRCCHVDVIAKRLCISKIKRSDSEGDTGSTENSGNTPYC
jgi:hypothetical protein